MNQESTEPFCPLIRQEDTADRPSDLSEKIKKIKEIISNLPLSPSVSLRAWDYDEANGIVNVELIHWPILDSINISLIRGKDGSIADDDD
jgi:hypothetical protein